MRHKDEKRDVRSSVHLLGVDAIVEHLAASVEIRAQIDTENVKGPLLINGGGAVALLALLPSVIGKPEYYSLTKAILYTLLLCFGHGNRKRTISIRRVDRRGEPRAAPPQR